jgi:nitrogen fixation NifU-like protein
MNPMLSLYQEIILDHNRHPRNFGHLDPCTHQAQGFNPLCGDKVFLTLNVGDEDELIREIAFEGTGCAISVASASLMTEALRHLPVKDARGLIEAVHELIVGGTVPPLLEDEHYARLKALAGVHEFPARVKCATLAWQTLRAALDRKTQEISSDPRF